MPKGLGGYQPDTKSASSRRADFNLQRQLAKLKNGDGGNGGGGGGITTEDAVDAVAGALTEGTGIDIVYNDAANTITVSATGTGADEVWIGPDPPIDPNIELWYDTNAAASTTNTTIIAVPYNSWPPADPQPDVLYLRIAP